MDQALLTVAYLTAGVLFILSLGGLSAQETARRGTLFGIIGMVIASVGLASLNWAFTGPMILLAVAVVLGAGVAVVEVGFGLLLGLQFGLGGLRLF